MLVGRGGELIVVLIYQEADFQMQVGSCLVEPDSGVAQPPQLISGSDPLPYFASNL